MKNRKSQRAIIAGAGVAALMTVGLLSTTARTEAIYADKELTAATLTSGYVDAPVVTSCQATATEVRIEWTSPAVKSDMRPTINSIAIPAGRYAQAGSGPYVFTATLTAQQLKNMLGPSLAATNTFAVRRALAGSQWLSEPATKTLNLGTISGKGGPDGCA